MIRHRILYALALTGAVALATLAIPSAARAQSGQRSYEIMDRVEVNYDGTWFPGNILQVGQGRYQVARDNYMTDDRWYTPADLRPLARPGRTLPRATAASLRAVPTGAYLCTTIMSGFGSSSSTRTTIGTLRVVGPGVYTGVAKQGSGPRSTFKYDAPSGRIDLESGALAGFFGKVVESRFGLETEGTPYLNFVYRVREGGSLYDLSCRREGA